MKMISKFHISISLAVGLFFFLPGCKNDKLVKQPSLVLNDSLIFYAVAAPDWTSLMVRDSGWFGADGIFSIPLNGSEDQEELKKTLFIFSDTYIGEVENSVPLPGAVMVNNSAAYLEGKEAIKDSISFEYLKNDDGEPISYFTPDNKMSKEGQYFWLGDGFINPEKDSSLYLFSYHVEKTGPNVFDFEQSDVVLLKIKDPSSDFIGDEIQIPTHLGRKDSINGRVYFGSGILANTSWGAAFDPDGFIYIYGIMEARKSLIAARTLPQNIENPEKWTFWNGSNWVKDSEEVVSLKDGVSNELSVTPTGDGRYLLTFTIMGLSDKIGVCVGDSPVGPFGPIREVYTCPEYAEKGLFTYNAKAHYHLSEPGKLLISYNTITLDFWEDIKKDATIYHPRFIWLHYE